GWFSYQNRRTFVDLALHQQNIANVKAWCQYHPAESVMYGLQQSVGTNCRLGSLEDRYEMQGSCRVCDFDRRGLRASCGSDQAGHEQDHLRKLARIRFTRPGFRKVFYERLLQRGRKQ